MTEEKKEKLNSFFNVAYKFIVMGLLGLIFIQVPKMLTEIRSLSFDTSDDKINTKNHVNQALNLIELHELKEHINNPDFHMPKREKDSFYVTRDEYDDLVKRLTITNWQTKESVKDIQDLIHALMDKINKQ